MTGKVLITARQHSGHRDDYANIGGVFVTARQRGEAYVTSDGIMLDPLMKDEVTLSIGPSAVNRPEVSMPLGTLRSVIEELTHIADSVERGLHLPEHKASTLLFTNEHGDPVFMGDLEAGKVLVRTERHPIMTLTDDGCVLISLCEDEDMIDESEWGKGKTEEEAWRFALGSYFGPDDGEFDEEYLRAALAAGRYPGQD